MTDQPIKPEVGMRARPPWDQDPTFAEMTRRLIDEIIASAEAAEAGDEPQHKGEDNA